MDPTERFSARADAYARARPSYPQAVFDVLREHYTLAEGTVGADLGAGTGIFSRLLLEAGAVVFAVEPNADMRLEAERSVPSARAPFFRSIAARAEETSLPAASIDLVTAAQAFHWFDIEQARRECL